MLNDFGERKVFFRSRKFFSVASAFSEAVKVKEDLQWRSVDFGAEKFWSPKKKVRVGSGESSGNARFCFLN